MGLRLPDRWIWDSWYFKEGDTYHVFYLCASRGLVDGNRRHRNPSIGHAVSKDLENWTIVADALTPSDDPAFDSWTTWTGSVIKNDDGKYYMFYTGTAREDGGLTQRIGLATSDDLITWTKHSKDALVEADGTWYEKFNIENWPDEAWRDPWVFRFPGEKTWHMLITARSKHGNPKTRGVLGHATSENLIDWTVQPPLSAPDQGYGQQEVFQFEIVDGVPILLFCVGWRELSEENLARFGKTDASYSLVVDPKLQNIDFNNARPFPGLEAYASRLICGPDGKWFLMGFINEVDGKFVGELCDAIPVTADPVLGLIPR
jgi:beta-fructofuranosidase